MTIATHSNISHHKNTTAQSQQQLERVQFLGKLWGVLASVAQAVNINIQYSHLADALTVSTGTFPPGK